MSTPLIDEAKAAAKLRDLVQELGVHALMGAAEAGYITGTIGETRKRSLAAVTCLLLAARECASAVGSHDMFIALCAAEVPGVGLRPLN